MVLQPKPGADDGADAAKGEPAEGKPAEGTPLKARRLKPLQKASSLWLRLQLHHRVCCCRHRHRQCILQRRQRNFRQRRRRLQMIMEGRQYHAQEMTGTGGPSGSTTAKQLATCLKQRLRRGKRRQPPSRCRSSRRSPRRKMTRVGPRRPRRPRRPGRQTTRKRGEVAKRPNGRITQLQPAKPAAPAPAAHGVARNGTMTGRLQGARIRRLGRRVLTAIIFLYILKNHMCSILFLGMCFELAH